MYCVYKRAYYIEQQIKESLLPAITLKCVDVENIACILYVQRYIKISACRIPNEVLVCTLYI